MSGHDALIFIRRELAASDGSDVIVNRELLEEVLDELVELRTRTNTMQANWHLQPKLARAEALEEAARECEAANRSRPSRWIAGENCTTDEVWRGAHAHCASAIRALKDRGDE